MAYAGGGAAAAAAAAAIANAIKASGVLVKVDEGDFFTILSKAEKPLVITASGGLVKKNYQYLTSYKGFAFYTKSATPLTLPGKAEIISAKQIWIPG
jgi:hypothetical protein